MERSDRRFTFCSGWPRAIVYTLRSMTAACHSTVKKGRKTRDETLARSADTATILFLGIRKKSFRRPKLASIRWRQVQRIPYQRKLPCPYRSKRRFAAYTLTNLQNHFHRQQSKTWCQLLLLRDFGTGSRGEHTIHDKGGDCKVNLRMRRLRPDDGATADQSSGVSVLAEACGSRIDNQFYKSRVSAALQPHATFN
jgi:hypothetical protein